jgi:hypothetical protein
LFVLLAAGAVRTQSTILGATVFVGLVAVLDAIGARGRLACLAVANTTLTVARADTTRIVQAGLTIPPTVTIGFGAVLLAVLAAHRETRLVTKATLAVVVLETWQTKSTRLALVTPTINGRFALIQLLVVAG